MEYTVDMPDEILNARQAKPSDISSLWQKRKSLKEHYDRLWVKYKLYIQEEDSVSAYALDEQVIEPLYQSLDSLHEALLDAIPIFIQDIMIKTEFLIDFIEEEGV